MRPITLYMYTIALLIFVMTSMLFASDNVTTFRAPLTVNDFFSSGDTLYVATSGGLRIHNLNNDETQLISSSRIFPDQHLTAIARDNRDNLWIASRSGYLYRRTPRGQYTTFSNYQTVNWEINALQTHGAHIVVGSNRGASIFDPQSGVALRNATQIAEFTNPRVNAIALSANSDTLFLGGEEGVAFIDGLNTHPLTSRNFYDAAIWQVLSYDRATAFAIEGGGVTPYSVPVVKFRNRTITANDNRLVVDDVNSTFVVGSQITTFFADGDRRLLIGTSEHFYYEFDGFGISQHFRMDGMTLRRASRVFATPNGDIWFLPEFGHPNIFWHHAPHRFDGTNWHIYGSHTHGASFGGMGDNPALGFSRGLDGTVWIGTSGGNLKHINLSNNTVRQLVVGNLAFSNINMMIDGQGDNEWGKVDAVVTDSSGYLWFSVYDSDFGSLICYDQRFLPNAALEYDPRRANFRRFFNSPSRILNRDDLLHVDASNRIFSYSTVQNMLTIFTHNGNPLVDGIEILRTHNNVGIAAIAAGDNGDTYMVGAGGLMRVRANSLDIDSINSEITNAVSIAIGGGVAWLGTRTSGVLRYDLATNEWRRVGEAMLPSSEAMSVALDSRRGHLWVVTDDGVSRLDIGRVGGGQERGRGLRIFPNVFSISGSGQGASHITFAGLRANSSVSIYTVSGALVDRIDAFDFGGTEGGGSGEWRAEWTPRRNLVPGTYIAVGDRQRAKFLLRP